MRSVFSLLLFLFGCTNAEEETLDLTERLGPGEARAGQIEQSSALFGGISAEGQIGDWKMYNSRAQFIIQGMRPGHFYVDQGGGVVDADIVRPVGQPGCDMVDEWMSMVGFGRLLDPLDIAVLSDGSDGSSAVLRVSGRESPMELITGAAESSDLIPDYGLEIVTTYTLAPDSPLLEVTTVVTSPHQSLSVNVGDVLMASMDVSSLWDPGVGYEAPNENPRRFTAYVAQPFAGAAAVIAAPNELGSLGSLSLLAELTDLAAMTSESVMLDPGGSFSHTRYYGVGRDLAEITDAIGALDGTPMVPFDTTVLDAGGPVAGARVTVMVDGDPWSQAVSDTDGQVSMNVPAEGEISIEIDGRGTAIQRGLPDGALYFSPYAHHSLKSEVLDSFSGGSSLPPISLGRGTSQGGPLGTAVELTVTASDGLPFEMRLSPNEPTSLDRRVYLSRYDGEGVMSWGRGGSATVRMEPGSYRLRVHRGLRFERYEQDIVLSRGEAQTIEVELPQAYMHQGYILGDPHSHSAPSNDAAIPMSERLMVAAGVGLQMHFGTDHDHVADYNPILAPLGIDDVLVSVVADEVSPVLRGHLNLYPLEQWDTANGGAWLWWANPVESTEQQMEILRDHHSTDFRIQVNHPLDSGLGTSANWSPGVIGNSDRWSTNFDAVEVMNAGQYESYLGFFMDIVNRGILVTPVGVSDSHSHTGGSVGLSATFFGMGFDDVTQYTNAALVDSMDARNTIVSRGPFLSLSTPPGSVVTGSDIVTVDALSPSWMQIDRIQLLKNGELVETVEGTSAVFELVPEADSQFVIVAEGDTPMGGAWGGRTPWAMSSPIMIDVLGDGWDPPMAPLELR